MNSLWDQQKFVGNNDRAVSPHLKTWIKQNGVIVCGVTGDGTSKEVQANWDSPYEGESAGSKLGQTAGVAQIKTGMTTVTTLNSRQVWSGSRPTHFNIVLQLYALSDPRREVMDALIELEKMASPQVNANDPGNLFGGGSVKMGRIPGTVSINIGRNAVYKDCILENVSIPLDGEKNKDGLLIRAEVNLSVQTMQMINRSDIASKYR